MGKPATTDQRRTPVPLYCLLAAITAGLLSYSQTEAFAWDEGFHILAAQLIKHGKQPYIDFVFSQVPLNAYWNAGWMAAFGESWRVVHAVAALCSAGAVVLTAAYVWSRFPERYWCLPAAIAASLLVGLNVLVVGFGCLAQAYGLCLLAIVAAYGLTILSVEQDTTGCAAWAGFFCGVSGASSLLTAPVGPVLLLWILVCDRAGRRWMKSAAFVLGGMVPLLPVFFLLTQGPHQVYFGIVEYNLRYRILDWPDATSQNVDVYSSWIDCGPALLLILLAAGGLLFVYFQSGWERRRKAEFYLCAWLSIALAAHISSARPTFARYYLFTVPFLSILAMPGFYAGAIKLYRPDRPWQPLTLLAFLLSFGLAKWLWEERDSMVWPDLEETAKKVNKVTPPQAILFADEAIYFLTRRAPPPGMEMRDSHKFKFSQDRLALLRLIPQAELDRQVAAGVFGTLETCSEQDDLEKKKQAYARFFPHSESVGDCAIFW